MTNAKRTKRALGSSVLALFLCFAMLLGTTYAWFTDSVTSANNIIKSGNLDIELEYWDGDSWETVENVSTVLANTLWEPGVTEVAYLRVANAGSLALKYQLGINVVDETAGINAAGESFLLSDYIQFGVVELDSFATYATREAAVAAVAESKKISAGYTKASTMVSGDELYLALVVYMPTTVGNEANHNGTNVPEIKLGINVVATQVSAESDSFGTDYDDGAFIPVTPETVPEQPTEPLVLTGSAESNVTISVPADILEALDDEVTAMSIAASAPVVNAENSTISFSTVELVDQDGNVIDLAALNTGAEITVTLPIPEATFATGETVMVYHDGEYVANAVVTADGKIVYTAAHLCEVTIGAVKKPVVNENNVIEIGTAAELMGLALSVNAGNDYKGKTIVLTNNIDLNNVAWTPIGTNAHPLRANFDGAGYTISNLNVTNDGWAGLIGHAGLSNGITITNLTVKNVTINSNRMAGAIAGQLYGSIDNCHVENVTINVTPNAVGESYDNGDKVGGIVGWIGDNGNKRTLTNCTVTNVKLSAYRDVGGIAGYVASSTTVANNTVANYTITVDQTINFYGEKDPNAGAILGRINGAITTENNVATGEESKVVTIYYKNGLVLKASSDSEEVLLYKVPSSCEGGTVIVPEGVTNLGRALAYKQFAKLVIPSTVTSASKALEKATIDEIVIAEGATTIPNRMFYSANIGNVVIPSTVTVIEQNAFAMAVVTEVVIPASVTTIEEAAFTHADYLETVTIMGNTAIQGYAFRGCDRLRTVYLYGDDVTFIKSTLNGRNSTWFCNNESNNPNVSNITFIVRSEEIKERVLTAMGAERNNTPVFVITTVTTAEELQNAVKAGGYIMLGADIAMESTIIPSKNFVLDGNGYTITMAENCVNTYALFDSIPSGTTVEFRNVTFDGIKGGAIVRSVGATVTLDNVTAINCIHTQQQGLFRLLGKSTIINSTFKNNTCSMVITQGFDTNENVDPMTVENCVFEENTCSSTAVLYYANGSQATIDGNVFKNNVINTTANGATVYLGYKNAVTFTNNIVMGNKFTSTGTSARSSGGIMTGGTTAVIKNNAFVGNTAENANGALGGDVCASSYYGDIDLSGNYWGGSAPQMDVQIGDDFRYNNVIVDPYLTTYAD